MGWTQVIEHIDRARIILGFDPKIDVRQGIENYHAWLKSSVYRYS